MHAAKGLVSCSLWELRFGDIHVEGIYHSWLELGKSHCFTALLSVSAAGAATHMRSQCLKRCYMILDEFRNLKAT